MQLNLQKETLWIWGISVMIFEGLSSSNEIKHLCEFGPIISNVKYLWQICWQPIVSQDFCSLYQLVYGHFESQEGVLHVFVFDVSSVYRHLRARRALMHIKDVPLRTRRALLPFTLYSNSALLVLNGTSLSCNNALLALNWRYCMSPFRAYLSQVFHSYFTFVTAIIRLLNY